MVSGSWEFSCPPDYEEYFEERQYQFACLGLKAAQIAAELRESYDIEVPEQDLLDAVERMFKQKALIENRRMPVKTAILP